MFKRVLMLSLFLLMFVGFSAWADIIACPTNANGIVISPTTCFNTINSLDNGNNAPFTFNSVYNINDNDNATSHLSYNSFQDIISNFNANNSLLGFQYEARNSTLAATGSLGGVTYSGSYWFGTNTDQNCKTASACNENVVFGYKNSAGQWISEQFQSGETYTPASGSVNSNLPPQFASTENINNIITGTGNQSLADVLKDWLKSGAGQAFLTGYLQTRVAVAPFDPVAGNPSSYMGQAVQENFELANLVNFQTNPTGGLNLFNMTPQYSIFNADGVSQTLYSLPLRDVYYISDNNSLIFDLPLSYTDTSGSTTYAASVGVAYVHSFQLPASITWSVSPSIHAGADGSESFAAATLVYNGGLSSNIAVPVGQFGFNLVDNVTYLKTGTVTVSGYATPYNLNNTLTENGADVNYALTSKFSVGVNYSNTDVITGTIPWFINNYNQVGGSISLNKDYKGVVYNFLTIGASYLFAPHFNGENINIGLNF